MAGGNVKFKHFKSNSENGLCGEMQEWVNGETPNISWVSEFHIVEGTDGKWHSFVKYIEGGE